MVFRAGDRRSRLRKASAHVCLNISYKIPALTRDGMAKRPSSRRVNDRGRQGRKSTRPRVEPERDVRRCVAALRNPDLVAIEICELAGAAALPQLSNPVPLRRSPPNANRLSTLAVRVLGNRTRTREDRRRPGHSQIHDRPFEVFDMVMSTLGQNPTSSPPAADVRYAPQSDLWIAANSGSIRLPR